VKIVDIRTTILRQPDVRPIADGIQDVLVVEVLTDDGVVGIGEVHTSPSVARAVIEAPLSHVSSRGLKEILVGKDPLQRELLWDEMYRLSSVYGRRGVAVHAISGIDIALWDIAGKVAGMSVSQLLGGDPNRAVKAYASILLGETSSAVRDDVRQCIDGGFLAVKLGWGPLSANLMDCVKLIEAARREAGDGIDLMVDIGFGADVRAAMQFARVLESLGVYFLEEPLSPDNLDGYARLVESSGIAIATGEKETTCLGFRRLIEIGHVDIIQPDAARAGGITEVKKIIDLARVYGVSCIPHCWSSDILVSATLQLISCSPSIPYMEFCTLETPLRRTVTTTPIRVESGRVRVPSGPGLGIELNAETMKKYGVRAG
jgi:L-rhamnonate dehydratase